MLNEPRQLIFDVPNAAQPETAHRIACYQWGNPQAEKTVLCMHGLTRNGRDFDVLAQALAAGCRVLCPDMPGRGKSDWLQDQKGYSYPAYSADIAFILDQLSIKHVRWIGTSMGGIIGMMMANSHPGLITALALNDIGCLIPAAGMQRIADLADVQTVFASHAEAEAAFRQRTASFGIREEAQWQHLLAHAFDETGDGNLRFAYDPAIFASFPKDAAMEDLNLWPLWEAVTKIPVLLIRGAESDLLTHDTALEMQARHPSLTLREIPGCGHAPALMDESQIALVREWIC